MDDSSVSNSFTSRGSDKQLRRPPEQLDSRFPDPSRSFLASAICAAIIVVLAIAACLHGYLSLRV